MTLRQGIFALALLLVTAHVHAVDWGRLIHGAPPKAPPPKQLATVTTAPEVKPDANVDAFLRAFAAAIKARDAEAVLPRLSERYSIDGIPDGSRAPDVFAQAVEQVPGPSELVVQAIERRGAETNAIVEVRYPTAPPKTRTLRFDAAGRLLWSDLFAIQVNRNGS